MAMTANVMSKVEVGSNEMLERFKKLAGVAWSVRENAYIIGKTRVGCALMTSTGSVFSGCNVEHQFRSHDVHAEVNAISSMAAAGERSIDLLLVVAERDRFTPCGACMDWIMQFASETCIVAFQGRPAGEFTLYTTMQLMPFYPH
jgi:cytidine deaminase